MSGLSLWPAESAWNRCFEAAPSAVQLLLFLVERELDETEGEIEKVVLKYAATSPTGFPQRRLAKSCIFLPRKFVFEDLAHLSKPNHIQ
jgi:hypothetical protein